MNRTVKLLPQKAALALAALTMLALSGCIAEDTLNDDNVHYASHASDNFPLQTMRHGGTKCGDWSQDMTETADNVRYANHGCAVQANIAAMIANPNTINHPVPADMPLGDKAAAAVRNMNSTGSSASSTGGLASLFGSP